jgi:hypothetical protein
MDGVERPLLNAREVAREWVKRCVRVLYKDLDPKDSDADAFWRGKPGVALIDLRMLLEVSEIGGEGGVAVADVKDFIGGVANKGDDTVDPSGERSKISGVCGVEGVRCKATGFLRRPPCSSVLRSFSWTISFSIFNSDSSSRRR